MRRTGPSNPSKRTVSHYKCPSNLALGFRYDFDGAFDGDLMSFGGEARSAEPYEARNAEYYTISRSTLRPTLPCVPLYLARPSTLPPRVR